MPSILKIVAYHSLTTFDEAVTLLAEEGRTIGGADLLINPRYMAGKRGGDLSLRYPHGMMLASSDGRAGHNLMAEKQEPKPYCPL